MGFVVDEDRGSLPYRLIHGEALVAAAAWAMGEAGVDLVDITVPWHVIADLGRALVLHDPLCPMTPPAFIAECARTAVARDVVVVGVRPVTDTVKRSRTGASVGPSTATRWSRCARRSCCRAGVVAELGGRPAADFVELVAAPAVVVRRRAGGRAAAARRVASDEDIRVLEALTEPRGELCDAARSRRRDRPRRR